MPSISLRPSYCETSFKVMSSQLQQSHRERGPTLLSSLPNLQNLIKRDPASYTDEFLIQLGHYNALRTIIEHGISTSASGSAAASSGAAGGNGGQAGKAGADEERFRELVGFVAQVCGSIISR